MKIIAINRDELDSIKTLWESLNAHHLSQSTHFKGHFSEFTFEKRIGDLKQREHLIAYVAKCGNESIGYCIASVDGRAGEIESLFVKEEHRGQGVGEEMMTLALKWLEEKNCETIRVSIAEGNENALEFYRRFGFAERLIVMQRTHNHEAGHRFGNGGHSW